MNPPTTLDMMKKLSMDFPELWENAYSFQKISEHTLIVHTGTKTKKGYLKPCVIRWSMFDWTNAYLTTIIGS